VIGVFSLRGGVGVSTLATNLACGLAQLWGRSVALVDLSLAAGQSVLMLNLSLRSTWADLARIPVDELTLETVRRVLIHHSSGVSVLAAPRLPADGDLVSAELVQKVLAFLTRLFDYVILDLPHDFRPTTISGLTASDEIVALLAPEMASVRSMGTTLEVFIALGYQQKPVTLVMNSIFEKRGLAKREIETVLHRPIQWVVPFSAEVMVTALNQGIPPVINPTTQPGALFEDMAFKLSRAEDTQESPGNPSDAWKRVHERKETYLLTKR
jgi:pilus assembly protein CpaE